jgi:hypothetical protein
MNTQTIHLPDRIILIDTEAKIKEGDMIGRNTEPYFIKAQKGWNNDLDLQYRVILAATPALGDLPLLPLPDDEVKSLALEHIDTIMFQEPDLRMQAYNSYVLGYKAAKRNPHTKDELIAAIDNAFSAGVGFSSLRTFKGDLETFKQDYFKALEQKQQFIPEMEQIFLSGLNNDGEKDWIITPQNS